MNPEVVAVRPDVTIEVVIRYLRKLGDLPRRTETLFVVDRYDRYLGTDIARRILGRPAPVDQCDDGLAVRAPIDQLDRQLLAVGEQNPWCVAENVFPRLGVGVHA